jgi:tetratricopeptide (TPR) repeat protein
MSSRARSHILEDKSLAYLREVFPDSWVIHSFIRDYGIDIQVEIFAENGARTGIRFYGQVKATDKAEDTDLLQLDRQHLDYWSAHTDPVVLLRYSASSKQLRWCWIHDVGWLLKPNAQSLNVANFLKIWDPNHSIAAIERYLHGRREALFEPVTPPYKISIEKLGDSQASFLLAAKAAEAISSKSFRIQPKELEQGVFHVDITHDKIAASHCGLPGFVFHQNSVLTESELVDRSLLAIFLCACRYERILFARALATSTLSILYRAACDELKTTLFDALIFSLGLKYAAELLSPLLDEEPDEAVTWVAFMAVSASSSFKYGEEHSWRFMLQHWLKTPPIPDNSGPFAYNLGNALLHQGHWHEAADAFSSALENDPSYKQRSYFWDDYGTANFESDNFRLAIECYETSLSLKESAATRWRLGDSLFHFGQYDKAEAHFHRALPDLDEHDQDYVVLLIAVCREIQEIWNVRSQNILPLAEEDHERLNTSADQMTGEEVIGYLQCPMQKNAIDGRFNFNAGVFAAQHEQYLVATYRFLTCALRQRKDAETWVNAITCALNSNEIHMALLCAKSAYFYLGEQFLPWILGMMPNGPRIPEPIANIFQEMMIDLVDSFEQERTSHKKPALLRLHTQDGTKEFPWGSPPKI